MNLESSSIRRNNRIGHINNHGRTNVPPPIIFSPKCTRKDALLMSYQRAVKCLQDISNGDLTKIESLSNHMAFIENKKLFSQFCSIFPFDFFMNIILNHETFSFPALKCFSCCIKSNLCPITNYCNLQITQQLFEIQNNDGFLSTFHSLKIFSRFVLISVEIRDFLLNNGILDIISQYLSNERIPIPSKGQFMIISSSLLINFLYSEPKIPQIYFSSISNSILFYLNERTDSLILEILEKFSKQPILLYPDLQMQISNLIFNHFINTTSEKVGLFVYKFIKSNKITSIDNLQLTLRFLQQIDSVKLRKKCMKTLILHEKEWKNVNNEEICNILMNVSENSQVFIKKLGIKTLALYWDQSKMIDARFMNLLLCFLNDKGFGTFCIHVILSFLTSSFPPEILKHFLGEFWSAEIESQLAEIIENGNEEESNAASLLLNAFVEASSQFDT
ncbi:hypothetical protein TRFO_31095 [Tritrichomonas foetus]|uniref:Uncharacterized protein n=1 Tax=Tritrichomonas foetus TaxID=1144522 RepID=A0A1J4JWP7_9EUKA|nr:hypothetical protein TRFO_31095 [Tritrichomonas foetus]|eukprot:OHT01958.1 hypothetical protein TRFO_31095 [Tritrichomonas foetus]